jgi:hypothetical protein
LRFCGEKKAQKKAISDQQDHFIGAMMRPANSLFDGFLYGVAAAAF